MEKWKQVVNRNGLSGRILVSDHHSGLNDLLGSIRANNWDGINRIILTVISQFRTTHTSTTIKGT